MTGCCAVGCSNRSEKGCKLYYLPLGKGNEERTKIWLMKIKRKNFHPSRTVALCQEHFEPDQFEKRIPGKLMPNAIPTLFTYSSEPKRRKSPTKQPVLLPVNGPSSTEILNLEHSYSNPLLNMSSNQEDSHSLSEDISIPATTAGNVDLPFRNSMSSSEDLSLDNDIPITATAAGNVDLPIENGNMSSSEDLSFLKRSLLLTKKKLRKALREKEQLEKRYSNLFNPDQVKFLEHSAANTTIWSDETVKKALQLRFTCGYNGYEMLLSQGFPLPSDRTLRRRLQSVPFNNGIIPEAMEILFDRTDMNNS